LLVWELGNMPGCELRRGERFVKEALLAKCRGWWPQQMRPSRSAQEELLLHCNLRNVCGLLPQVLSNIQRIVSHSVKQSNS